MATEWGHASQCSGCSSIGGKKTVFVTSLSFFRLVTSKNNFVMTTKLFMEIECLGYNDVIINITVLKLYKLQVFSKMRQ